MISITEAQLQTLAPNIRSSYREAFKTADAVLAGYGINDNKRRLRHFMAQILHESGGLTIQQENMNYSEQRMMVVWPSRFPTLASAQPYAHDPEKLANKVYSNRMGNGGPASGDGWRYRGRGIMQITGREDYAKYGEIVGEDLIGDPDLAFAGAAVKIAAAEWNAKGCNAHADNDDINKITRLINGGLTGLASRKDWLAKTTQVWS